MSTQAPTDWAACPDWCTDCSGPRVESQAAGIASVEHARVTGAGVKVVSFTASDLGGGPFTRVIEVSADLEFVTPPQARELAAALIEAAAVLEAAGGYLNREEQATA